MTAGETVGILPVDKPEGPTSHDVVAMARRGLQTRRVGHTGTLDPFASGLLLLCVGSATRLSSVLTGLDKEYDAVAVLGVTTRTHDREGSVVSETDASHLTDRAIAEAVEELRGVQWQRPPAFSAKKVGGEAAHRRARRGETVDLDPVQVVVHALEVTGREGPRVALRVRCSSGTYVRALARDLGEALGVGAHLDRLRRTAVGDFTVAEAVPAGALAAVAPEAWISPAAAVRRAGVPWFEVEAGAAGELALGRPIAAGVDGGDASLVAAVEGERLLALGEVTGRAFQPRKVFVGG